MSAAPTHKCANCDWRGSINQVDDIDDIEQRVAAGEYFPAGQCPACGALVECTDNDVREAGNVPNARELLEAAEATLAALATMAVHPSHYEPLRAAVARARGTP